MTSNRETIRSEGTFFVGRTKELQLLHRHADGGSPWRWLHLYGQSGIGKSTLLRRFQSETEGGRCISIDGSKVLQQHEALNLLAERIKQAGNKDAVVSGESEDSARDLNSLARSLGRPIVLLIDSFDHWHAMEHGFLQWIDKLEGSIRIVTFGRSTLTGGWLRSGWADATHAVQLQALSASEVEQYAGERGISDLGDRSKLFRFSRGVPLAMILAAETILKGDEIEGTERKEKYELISVLIQELLQGQPAYVHRLLEAASVYWRFNEERLSAAMETELEPGAFRKFVGLPFVLMKEDGWMLHDAVRAWALEDFVLRKPNGFETMRRNALLHIRKEERLHPQLRSRLQIDKMSLHEHPIVRSICFSGHPDDEIELRECRESDLPAIQRLYAEFYRSAAPVPDDEPPLRQLLRETWEVDPASFITIWEREELVAFFGKVPLHNGMLKVLRKEPLLRPFLSAWQPVPNAYLFAIVGIKPDVVGSTSNHVINAMINHFSRSEWILDFTCFKEWFPVFELCGFERGAWADAVSDKGTEYRAFILDLRQEDFIAKLDRSVSRMSVAQASADQTPKSNIEEFKNILKHWSVIPRQPAWARSYFRLFPHRANIAMSDEDAGHSAQEEIKAAIQLLAEGDESEEQLGKLLTALYLEKIRPHERVAKRLNVSMATYYRHLNKALEVLYLSLDNGGAK